MIIWNIEIKDASKQIEVGPLTILRGNHSFWFNLVRSIDDFFNNKTSDVRIYEDTQLINKKDWECFFIPYDAHLQLNKVTSKSPLKPVLERLIDELASTYVFQQLLEVWDEVGEELEFINQKLKQYDLKLQLQTFDSNDFKNFLYFSPLRDGMTPINHKQLLLNLINSTPIEKNILIIIELPELFAYESEFQEFNDTVNTLVKKGIKVLLVTQKNFNSNYNQVYKDEIINMARLDIIKNKVISQVPFYCEDELYNKAKDSLLTLVDKSNLLGGNLNLNGDWNEQVTTLLYAILNEMGIDVSLDTSGFSSNLVNFCRSIS